MGESNVHGLRRRLGVSLLLSLSVGLASAAGSALVMWAWAMAFADGEQLWLIPVIVLGPATQFLISALATWAAFLLRPTRSAAALLGVASWAASPTAFALVAGSLFDYVSRSSVALVAGGAILGALGPMSVLAKRARQAGIPA